MHKQLVYEHGIQTVREMTDEYFARYGPNGERDRCAV